MVMIAFAIGVSCGYLRVLIASCYTSFRARFIVFWIPTLTHFRSVRISSRTYSEGLDCLRWGEIHLPVRVSLAGNYIGHMLAWQQLVRLSDQELAGYDIALTNLACARGLPDSDHMDIGMCLRTLDSWAEQTRRFTDRVMPLFYHGRCDYPDSEPRFRIQAMITYLQRGLGLRFRWDRRSEEASLEPADYFLPGIMQGKGGTCASLPVLYTAIGRRLGYPLRLAQTRGHRYVRWEDPGHGETFNIEASGDGVSCLADDYYCSGRYALAAATLRACGYLESLTPREEVASFLADRGECWMQYQAYSEAALAFAWANELDPRRQQYAFLTGQALRVWEQHLRARLPRRLFPLLAIGLFQRQFVQLPQEAERALIRLRILEGLLADPELEARWWGPLRRSPPERPPDLPRCLQVDFRWHDCNSEAIGNS